MTFSSRYVFIRVSADGASLLLLFAGGRQRNNMLRLPVKARDQWPSRTMWVRRHARAATWPSTTAGRRAAWRTFCWIRASIPRPWSATSRILIPFAPSRSTMWHLPTAGASSSATSQNAATIIFRCPRSGTLRRRSGFPITWRPGRTGGFRSMDPQISIGPPDLRAMAATPSTMTYARST